METPNNNKTNKQHIVIVSSKKNIIKRLISKIKKIMKKFNLFLILFALTTAIIFTSCEKGEENPSDVVSPTCNNVCQNGGTVNANCGCDCPSGFTGTNCQTPVVSIISVPLNPNYARQLAPVKYWGDDDFGGCISINWKVQLVFNSTRTKVYAEVFADYRECGSTGNTAAWIDPDLSSNQILLYTAPTGKKILNVNCGSSYSYTEIPNHDYHGTITRLINDNNSFLNKLEFIGDTQGSDLPYDGTTERSRCRVYFKTFNVSLINK